MFRTISIDEFQSFLVILDQNQSAIAYGFSCNFFPWQLFDLAFNLLFYGFNQLFRCGYQNHLTVNAVLCLTQQVRSHKGCIGRIICHDQQFTGAGGHIDRYPVFGGQLLCNGYILVTGAKYFVHLRNAFRTKGHAGNRLNASHFNDLRYATQLGGI